MRQVMAVVSLLGLVISAASAADKNWNHTWELWNDPGNWLPAGVPNAGHSVWIGYLAGSACFLRSDSGAAARTLTVDNGAGLGLDSRSTMLVNTSAIFDKTDDGDVFLVMSTGSAFRAPEIRFSRGAELDMRGGVMLVTDKLVVDSDSLIEGEGFIQLDAVSGAGFELDGTLTVTGGWMNITAPGGATADLDGFFGRGVVNILEPVSRLRVYAQLTDWFGGEMNIGEGNWFDSDQEWTCDGTINMFGGSTGFASIRSPKTTIRGRVNVSRRGYMNEPVELGPGSVVNVPRGSNFGTHDATLNGTWITGAGVTRHLGDVAVTGDSTVDVGVYVLDHGVVSRNMTVEPGVTFTINSYRISPTIDDKCTNVFYLNNATLEMNNTAWTLRSTVYMHDQGVGMIPTVDGAMLTVDPAGAADKGLQAEAGICRVNCPVVFEDGGSGSKAGAILDLNGGADYRGGTHAGQGELRQDGLASFSSGTTTIETAVYNWDGSDGSTWTTVQAGARANIHPGAIDAHTVWDDDGFDGTIVLWDSAVLDVNPTGAASWRLDGQMDLNGGRVSGDHLIVKGTVSGWGSITSSDLTNNGVLRGDGGTLRLDTAAFPDLDGDGPETGVVEALDGDVVVGTSFPVPWGPFDGTIRISKTRTFEIEHGGLKHNGLMELRGGTFEGPVLEQRGNVTVSAATATLRTYVQFHTGSTTTLAARLEIDGMAEIFRGASITGSEALVILPGSTLCGDGVVDVEVINHGRVRPGSSAGVLECAAFTQGAKGVLELEIGGVKPGGEHDQLIINGHATLDGRLEIALIGGFDPQVGDAFEILSAGTRTGWFAEVVGWNLGDRALVCDYRPGAVVVVTAFPGDANIDNKVDVFDLAILGNNYFQSGKDWGDADFTGEGDVNVFDLAILANNYGRGTGGGDRPIPEPAAILIVTAAGLPMLLKRRRNA